MMGTTMQMGTGTVKPPIRANAHLFQPAAAVASANEAIVALQERATLTHAEVLTALHRLDVQTAQPTEADAAVLLDKSGKPLVTHFHVQRLRQMLSAETQRHRATVHAAEDDEFTESWTPDRPKRPQPESSQPRQPAAAAAAGSVAPAHLPYTSATAAPVVEAAAAAAARPDAIAQALAALSRKKSEKLAQSHALTGEGGSSSATLAHDAAVERQQQRLNQQVVQQFSDDRVIHAQFADWERKDRLSQLLAIQAFGGSAAAAAAGKLSQALPRSVAPLATAPLAEAPKPEVLAQTNPVVRLPPKVSTLRKKQKLMQAQLERQAQLEQLERRAGAVDRMKQQPIIITAAATTSTIAPVPESHKRRVLVSEAVAVGVSGAEQRSPPAKRHKAKAAGTARPPAELHIVIPAKPATTAKPLKRMRVEPAPTSESEQPQQPSLKSARATLAQTTPAAAQATFVVVPRPLIAAKRRVVRLFD
jgi:hypothetical protein